MSGLGQSSFLWAFINRKLSSLSHSFAFPGKGGRKEKQMLFHSLVPEGLAEVPPWDHCLFQGRPAWPQRDPSLSCKQWGHGPPGPPGCPWLLLQWGCLDSPVYKPVPQSFPLLNKSASKGYEAAFAVWGFGGTQPLVNTLNSVCWAMPDFSF